MNPLDCDGPYLPISFILIPHLTSVHTQIIQSTFVNHKSSALVNGQAVSSKQVSLRVSNFTLDLRNAAQRTLRFSYKSYNIRDICLENGHCCHNAWQCLLHPRPLHKCSMAQIPIAARKPTGNLDNGPVSSSFLSQAAIISAVLRLPTTLPASSQRCKHMMFSIKAPVTLQNPAKSRQLATTAADTITVQIFYT